MDAIFRIVNAIFRIVNAIFRIVTAICSIVNTIFRIVNVMFSVEASSLVRYERLEPKNIFTEKMHEGKLYNNKYCRRGMQYGLKYA